MRNAEAAVLREYGAAYSVSKGVAVNTLTPQSVDGVGPANTHYDTALRQAWGNTDNE